MTFMNKSKSVNLWKMSKTHPVSKVLCKNWCGFFLRTNTSVGFDLPDYNNILPQYLQWLIAVYINYKLLVVLCVRNKDKFTKIYQVICLITYLQLLKLVTRWKVATHFFVISPILPHQWCITSWRGIKSGQLNLLNSKCE